MVSYTIAAIGAPMSGKTAWIERLRTGEFITPDKYQATPNNTKHELSWTLTTGKVTTYLVENPTSFDGIDAVIYFMHPLCDPGVSFVSSISGLQDPVKNRVIPNNIPTVTVRSFCDLSLSELKVRPFPTKQFYAISAKSNYNFEKPILFLLRKLLCDEKVKIIEEPRDDPIPQSVNA